ncbi:MAG: condensation domain-containing protein, partial [Ruminococcus sp.]|nr:condensation domain-containing protein [Ruminococcus sp.]
MDKRSKSQLIQNIYSLTPLQEGMLYHCLVSPDTTGYILQNYYQFNFELDIKLLKEAISLLSMRYDVLRTMIMYEKVKSPKQVVLKKRDIEFNLIDLSDCDSLPENEKNIIHQDLIRGFNFQKDTLIRFTYIKIPDNKCKLLFTIHHIIVDGWCNSLLINKLMEYYDRLFNGTPFETLTKEIAYERKISGEYKDYLNWIERKNPKKALAYWKDLLDDYDNSNEIAINGKLDNCEEQSCNYNIKFNSEISSKLFNISKENNITINTLIETLVGILLQKSMGSNDVVFSKVISGRDADIPDVESIVGLFINTIPVRVKYDKDTTLKLILEAQNQQANYSSDYGFCSLADIQNSTRQKGDLIKYLFVFENYAVQNYVSKTEKTALNAEDDVVCEYQREQTSYDLTINASFGDDVLAVSFSYLTEKFGFSDIKVLADRFIKICNAVCCASDIKISEIDVISDEEKDLICNKFNATQTAYP